MPKLLSEAQIAQYKRDGFLFPLRVMPAEAAAEVGAKLDHEKAAGRLRGSGQTKFYLRLPWVYQLATHPTVLDAVEDLIGPDIMLYHNTVWSKDGNSAAYISWHQDNTYFGHDPCEVLTVWCAITPANLVSGCMTFLPGTHKLGQLPLAANDTNQANMLSSGQTVAFDVASVEPVAAELQPGEASIHHAFLIHGSAPNRTAHQRMGMTFIYHPPSLRQLGACRTSALLVRGQDRFNNFDHEQPPADQPDQQSLARYHEAVAKYRAKVRELGNMTINRFD